jgi:hypothetical protein
MSKRRVLGLFKDFEEATEAVAEIRDGRVPGVKVGDVNVLSAVAPHPSMEHALGDRTTPVGRFTLVGGTFGLSFGFFLVSTAQSNFLVQPQGGKPVVPLPTDFIPTYEMLILFSVLFTLLGLIIFAKLLRPVRGLYSEKVSLDQVGILVDNLTDSGYEAIKGHFQRHNVLELREEVVNK